MPKHHGSFNDGNMMETRYFNAKMQYVFAMVAVECRFGMCAAAKF